MNQEPKTVQELKTWQICEELSRISAIKTELRSSCLNAQEPDPDTGYNLSDILRYEQALLKKVRSRRDRLKKTIRFLTYKRGEMTSRYFTYYVLYNVFCMVNIL